MAGLEIGLIDLAGLWWSSVGFWGVKSKEVRVVEYLKGAMGGSCRQSMIKKIINHLGLSSFVSMQGTLPSSLQERKRRAEGTSKQPVSKAGEHGLFFKCCIAQQGLSRIEKQGHGCL